MPLSLYDITVPSFRQTLGAVAGLLDKAEAYCAEKSIPSAELIDARLFDDMFPFSYQVKSPVTHSAAARRSPGRSAPTRRARWLCRCGRS